MRRQLGRLVKEDWRRTQWRVRRFSSESGGGLLSVANDPITAPNVAGAIPELVLLDSEAVRAKKKMLQFMAQEASRRALEEQMELELFSPDQDLSKLFMPHALAASPDQGASMVDKSIGVKWDKMLSAWLFELSVLIKMEQDKIASKSGGISSKKYSHLLLCLHHELLAQIALNDTLHLVSTSSDGSVTYTTLCITIGRSVQSQILALSSKRKEDAWEELLVRMNQKTGVTPLYRGLQWTDATCVKVGRTLIDWLFQVAIVQPEWTKKAPSAVPQATKPSSFPLFEHKVIYKGGGKTEGIVQVVEAIRQRVPLIPSNFEKSHRYNLPMVVEPNPWSNAYNGGYIHHRSHLVREKFPYFAEEKSGDYDPDLRKVYDGLNSLSRVPWKINSIIYEAALKYFRINPAAKQHYYRKDLLESERIREAEALHRLRIASKLLDKPGFFYPYSIDFRGRAYPIPAVLNPIGDDLCRGLLCFSEGKPLGPRGMFWLKIQLANHMGYDKQSLDNRGKWVDERLEKIKRDVEHARRHISDGSPATSNKPWTGWTDYFWMNADNPWQALAVCNELVDALQSDNPEEFVSHVPVQQDGSCNGLQHYAALTLDPEGAAQVNLLPGEMPSDVYSTIANRVKEAVEKDALLCKNKDPQHVGTFIRELMTPTTDTKRKKEIREELKPLLAYLLQGRINRKLVKQTVMTSVYGVTFRGASLQIRARLDEVRDKDRERAKAGLDAPTELPEHLMSAASFYLASLTMEEIKNTFKGAASVMDWFRDLARLIAPLEEKVAWVTPLGLPVSQPYRQSRKITVRGVKQSVVVMESIDSTISKRKQFMAFPPNYIHSLDSSHMLMTAVACAEKGIAFTSVHDSYWTHACDVDAMNLLLREKFVELHTPNLLEALYQQFKIRFPGVKFPPPPKRMGLDLDKVKESKYFFS